MSVSDKYTDVLLPEWHKKNPDLKEDFEKLLTEPRTKRKFVPKGYTLGKDEGGNPISVPNPELIVELIKLLIDNRYKMCRSLRECMQLANELLLKEGDELGINTPGGLSILFTRIEKDLNVSEREDTSKDRVAKLRRERHKERAKQGLNRSYNLSKEEEAKINNQKKLTAAAAELKKLEKRKISLKQQAAKSARVLKYSGNPIKHGEKLDIKTLSSRHNEVLASLMNVAELRRSVYSKKSLVEIYYQELQRGVTPQNEESLLHMYKQIVQNGDKYSDRPIAFLPSPRQHIFMSSSEDIVLYGGAAGGGKSYVMMLDPLRYCHHKDFRAVIFRKTMTELTDMIDNSRMLYELAFPGARFKQDDSTWWFPSGAKIRFAYLDKPGDKYKYQGLAFQYIGFDELAQHDTSDNFHYLHSRLRGSNPEIQPVMRATANPGAHWVYELFIEPAEPNTTFIMPGTENNTKQKTMRFIPSNLSDNPHLDLNDDYRSGLEALPEIQRKQLLEGDWSVSDASMFPEFSPNTHVCEPFFIPKHWNRVAGLDYGYQDPSAAVWFAVDPETGDVFVYDELMERGLTGREFALAVRDREMEELVPVDHPIDGSIYARTGHTGPTIAESMLSVPGFRMRKADKNREAGWVQIHEYLRVDPRSGAPKMRVFSSCTNTVKQLLSARKKETNPADLKDTRSATNGHWDILDALRYGVMSRPRQQTFEERMSVYKRDIGWERANSYFN